jgi:hypothetical protein
MYIIIINNIIEIQNDIRYFGSPCKIFRSTIQEVHNESKKKVSDQKHIQQDARTTAMIRPDRKRLPFLASARELDDKSNSSDEGSVGANNGSVSTIGTSFILEVRPTR